MYRQHGVDSERALGLARGDLEFLVHDVGVGVPDIPTSTGDIPALTTIVRRVGEGAEGPSRKDRGCVCARVGSRRTLVVAHSSNQLSTRRIPGIGAADGILEADLRSAGVTRGIEGLPLLAEIMAAGGRADPIATFRQHLLDAEIVPSPLGAVAAIGVESADVFNAGVTIRSQGISGFAEVMRTHRLCLGRGGHGQP